MYYSQQGEDRILHEKYLNYNDGFFIELGAMNGVTYSNTLFFERELNWKGVLIEPTPSQFTQLVINRPNCHNFNYAISEIPGEVEFLGDGALGGMTRTMHESHRKGWGLDNTSSPYMVKSIGISELLRHLNLKRVDFFSIDVEGGELDVLKTFDWTIEAYVILIETHSFDENKNELCREILRKNNFEFDMVIGCNEVWVNKNWKTNEK